MAGLEISDVDFVEVTPFAHVGEHRSAFEHVVERQPVRFQHRAHIFHGLPGFCLNAASGKRAGTRHDTDCAG
jgi:hypothetical protein